jgi:hypothetical protein
MTSPSFSLKPSAQQDKVFLLKKATDESAKAMPLKHDEVAIKSLKRAPMPLNGTPKVSEAKLTETAQEFESVFISQMLKHVFEGQQPNELMGGGSAEEIYQDMMVDEYGKLIARTGGIGVADAVKQQMLKLQEVEK